MKITIVWLIDLNKGWLILRQSITIELLAFIGLQIMNCAVFSPFNGLFNSQIFHSAITELCKGVQWLKPFKFTDSVCTKPKKQGRLQSPWMLGEEMLDNWFPTLVLESYLHAEPSTNHRLPHLFQQINLFPSPWLAGSDILSKGLGSLLDTCWN